MPLTADELAARARLEGYNSQSYNVTTNPLGLADGGNVENYPRSLDDVALMGVAAAREADNAATTEGTVSGAVTSAQAAVQTLRDEASTFRDEAAASAVSAAAAADQVDPFAVGAFPVFNLAPQTGWLDRRLRVERDSTGTSFDATGTLVEAGPHQPRMDHDPATGQRLGVLREGESTNVIRNPRCEGATAGAIGGAGTMPSHWQLTAIPAGITATVIGTGMEDGIEYLDLRLNGTGAGTAALRFEAQDQTTASNGQTWTVSAFIKRVGGTDSNISPSLIVTPVDSGQVDLSGGGTNAIAPDEAHLSSQRVITTATLANAGTATVVSGLDIAITGAVDITWRIAGPQLEQRGLASTLIRPPVAAPAVSARVAEVMTADLSDIPGFNAARGAVLVEAAPYNFSEVMQLVSLDDGTGNNRIGLRTTTGGLVRGFVVENGTVPAAGDTVGALTAPFRTACSYNTDDFRLAADGAVDYTDTAVTLPAVTTLRLGGQPTVGEELYGHIRRFLIFPQPLSNSDLVLLTDITQSLARYDLFERNDRDYERILTAAYTARPGDVLGLDVTGGSFTVTLPATPQHGDTITVHRFAGALTANTVTIARNGHTIAGAAEDLVIDFDIPALTLRFLNNDWRVR